MKVSSGHLFVKVECPGLLTEYLHAKSTLLQKNPNKQNTRNQQRRMKCARLVHFTLPNEDSIFRYSPPAEEIPRMKKARHVCSTLPNENSTLHFSPPSEEIPILKSALRLRSTLPNADSTLHLSPPSKYIPRMKSARRVRFTLPNDDSIFRYSPPPEEIQIDLTDSEEHATENIQSPEIEVSSSDSELGVREKNVK